MIVIEAGNPRAPEVAALLQASHQLMEQLFPSDENHYLSLDALTEPGVHFFSARIGTKIVGTGAVVEQPGYGEIKSMFVDPASRGNGVAEALLRMLEDTARGLGLPMLRLETGNSLNSAMRLYGRHGFDLCGPFGDYQENATSVFMEKPLT